MLDLNVWNISIKKNVYLHKFHFYPNRPQGFWTPFLEPANLIDSFITIIVVAKLNSNSIK